MEKRGEGLYGEKRNGREAIIVRSKGGWSLVMYTPAANGMMIPSVPKVYGSLDAATAAATARFEGLARLRKS